MTTILIEKSTGAQILPPVRDSSARSTSWAAHLICNADWRKNNASIANELAENLLIMVDPR